MTCTVCGSEVFQYVGYPDGRVVCAPCARRLYRRGLPTLDLSVEAVAWTDEEAARLIFYRWMYVTGRMAG